MRYASILLITFLSVLFIGCNKDQDRPNFNGPGAGNGVIVADVNGQPWAAPSGSAQNIAPFGLQLQCYNGSDNMITLYISPYNGVQTYQLNGITKITYTEGGMEFTSTTGQITITSDTQEAVEGTFSCDAIANSGSIPLQFVNGQFRIPRY